MRMLNGKAEPDPATIVLGGTVISNPMEAQLVAAGYMPYVAPAAEDEAAVDARAVRRAECVAGIRAVFERLGWKREEWPADWLAAVKELRKQADAGQAALAGVELIALRLGLAECGGTWEMVTAEAEGGSR